MYVRNSRNRLHEVHFHSGPLELFQLHIAGTRNSFLPLELSHRITESLISAAAAAVAAAAASSSPKQASKRQVAQSNEKRRLIYLGRQSGASSLSSSRHHRHFMLHPLLFTGMSWRDKVRVRVAFLYRVHYGGQVVAFPIREIRSKPTKIPLMAD